MTNKLHVYYYIIYTTPCLDPVDFRIKITTSHNAFYQSPEGFHKTNKFHVYYNNILVIIDVVICIIDIILSFDLLYYSRLLEFTTNHIFRVPIGFLPLDIRL